MSYSKKQVILSIFISRLFVKKYQTRLLCIMHVHMAYFLSNLLTCLFILYEVISIVFVCSYQIWHKLHKMHIKAKVIMVVNPRNLFFNKMTSYEEWHHNSRPFWPSQSWSPLADFSLQESYKCMAQLILRLLYYRWTDCCIDGQIVKVSEQLFIDCMINGSGNDLLNNIVTIT